MKEGNFETDMNTRRMPCEHEELYQGDVYKPRNAENCQTIRS